MKFNITYNESKCLYSVSRMFALGHVIEDGTIKPDPDRLRPLQELPLPINGKELKRVIDMFSYYSQYTLSFLTKY